MIMVRLLSPRLLVGFRTTDLLGMAADIVMESIALSVQAPAISLENAKKVAACHVIKTRTLCGHRLPFHRARPVSIRSEPLNSSEKTVWVSPCFIS